MSRPDECRWRDKVAKLEKPCSLLLLIGMPRCAEATAVRLADEASDRQRRRKNKNGHSFPLFPSHFSRLVTKFSPSSVSLNLLFDLCSLSDRTPVILIAIEAFRRALFTDEFSLQQEFSLFSPTRLFDFSLQNFSRSAVRLLQSVLDIHESDHLDMATPAIGCWLLN